MYTEQMVSVQMLLVDKHLVLQGEFANKHLFVFIDREQCLYLQLIIRGKWFHYKMLLVDKHFLLLGDLADKHLLLLWIGSNGLYA